MRRKCAICNRRRVVDISGRCADCHNEHGWEDGKPCAHVPEIMEDYANRLLSHIYMHKRGYGFSAAEKWSVVPLPYLGNGADRVGYMMPCGHVFKVSYSGPGVTASHTQTQYEGETWEEVKDTDVAHLFAPVIEYDEENFKWLTMERASVWRDLFGYKVNTAPRAAWEKREELTKALHKLGIGDQHDGNVGFIEDRCVSLDYGLPAYKPMYKTVSAGGLSPAPTFRSGGYPYGSERTSTFEDEDALNDLFPEGWAM